MGAAWPLADPDGRSGKEAILAAVSAALRVADALKSEANDAQRKKVYLLIRQLNAARRIALRLPVDRFEDWRSLLARE